MAAWAGNARWGRASTACGSPAQPRPAPSSPRTSGQPPPSSVAPPAPEVMSQLLCLQAPGRGLGTEKGAPGRKSPAQADHGSPSSAGVRHGGGIPTQEGLQPERPLGAPGLCGWERAGDGPARCGEGVQADSGPSLQDSALPFPGPHRAQDLVGWGLHTPGPQDRQSPRPQNSRRVCRRLLPAQWPLILQPPIPTPQVLLPL